MHWGLPWAGRVSAKSATDGSGAPSCTRISPLILVNDLLILLLARRYELNQLVIHMHEMMMQHLVIQQQ